MSEPLNTVLIAILGMAIVIAVLSAALAFIANRAWPYLTVAALTQRTVVALAGVSLLVTFVWMLWLSQTPCDEGSACDVGAMAASGAAILGAVELIGALIIGAPVAYFTLRWLQRR